jgi:hypothetical protein
MKKQPIRIEKVEKYKKRITRVEKDKGRKLKPSERLFVIYEGNYLEDDIEQEEKGLSLKEFYLVLYDVNDVYKSSVYDGETVIDDETIIYEEYRKKLIEEQDFNDWFHLLKKTKAAIRYFNDSTYEKMRKAKDESEYHYFLISWKRTRKGVIRYYNMINEEDLEDSRKFRAKLVLAYNKTIQRANDKFERNEREEEEVRRGRRKKTSAQEREEEREKQREKERIEYMKKAKDWKGNPVYFDVDFRGVNLKDSLKEKKDN